MIKSPGVVTYISCMKFIVKLLFPEQKKFCGILSFGLLKTGSSSRIPKKLHDITASRMKSEWSGDLIILIMRYLLFFIIIIVFKKLN